MGLSFSAQNVLVGSVLLGAVGGTLGAFALLRRQSLLGDALAHAALPGVGLAFLLTLVLGQQPLGHAEPEHAIAEELKAVVVGALLFALVNAAVRQRLAQQRAILEHMAYALLQLRELGVVRGRPALGPGAQLTDLRKRSPRKPVNNVHGRKSDVEPLNDTTTNCAGPTRLS